MLWSYCLDLESKGYVAETINGYYRDEGMVVVVVVVGCLNHVGPVDLGSKGVGK